jgi:hypothetical protein
MQFLQPPGRSSMYRTPEERAMSSITRRHALVPPARHLLGVAACALAVLACSTSASAQEVTPGAADATVDARWQPWLGCWDLLRDTVHEPDATRPGEPFPRRAFGRAAEAGERRVCVSPADAAGEAAVRLRTDTGGEALLDETLVADGARHEIDDDPTCRGWRLTEWSADGRRLFGRAEVACGDTPPQTVSHLAFITGRHWLDIQGITTSGRQGVRVRLYRQAGISVPGPARTAVTGRVFDVDAVKEASQKLDPLVLQAALVETQARFPLDGRTMLALHEAGVPGDVTDVMVALSYPKRFRVRRADAGASAAGGDSWSTWDWLSGPFAYSGWAYGSWWGVPGVGSWGHWAPGWASWDPGSGGGGGAAPEGRGRVINNRGYTRIETIEPARVASGGNTSASGTSASSGGSGSSGSSGGSGSSGVTSQGYSGGGSSDGGRTAVPR